MYVLQSPIIGLPKINANYTPDATARAALGSIVSGTDPYWGGAEFVYLQAGTVMQFGYAAEIDGTTANALPNTGNTGRAVCFALMLMAVGQFAWFQISGRAPIAGFTTASALNAGDPFGIGGVGVVGTNAPGKQILNAVVIAPTTTSVAKPFIQTVTGQSLLFVPHLAGWFPNIALTGTGMDPNARIGSINGDGSITMTQPATADGVVTITGVYTGYPICQFDRPFVQGAIT